MATIGAGVSLKGLKHDPFYYAFNLASGITNDDVGKAVALDTSAANTVKLAGDGDPIIGRLAVVEDRSVEGILVGTVETKGGHEFTEVDTPTYALAVGDTVVGAGSGTVKARENAGGSAKESNHADNYVVAVNSGKITVVIR